MEMNAMMSIVVLIMLYSETESRDSHSFDSAYSRREPAENIEATYNIMIYNDNNHATQRYGVLGDILLMPVDSRRSSNYPRFERMNTIGQFESQSLDINQEHNDVPENLHPMGSNQRYPVDSNFITNIEPGTDIRRPARMLYDLLKNYGSFSESDFRTVYSNWFGH